MTTVKQRLRIFASLITMIILLLTSAGGLLAAPSSTRALIVQKADLKAAISAATANMASVTISRDGSEVAPTEQWVTYGVKAAYTKSISAAQSVFINRRATQATVDKAVATLSTATAAFDAAKKDGIKTEPVDPDPPAVTMPGPVEVDRSALVAAIDAANNNAVTVKISPDGTDVLPTDQWVTSAVLTTYTAAIATAQTVANDTAVAQTSIDCALSTLAAATSVFNSSKNAGTKQISPVPAPEGVTCTALGLVKNDVNKGRSNTALLLQAIQSNQKILVDGVYYLGYTTTKLSDTNISLTGITLDAEFKLSESSIVFYANNNVDIFVRGIKFTQASSGPAYLFRFAPTAFSNQVVIENSAFQGNMRCMWFTGSTTLNPAATPFGIKEFYFTDNTVNDTSIIFMNLSDMPSDKIVIEDNVINNFDYTFVHSGISNGLTYSDEMSAAKKLMVVRNNRVTCDDDWWGSTANTIYYCFALFEGIDCIYEGNHVEGLKFSSASGTGVPVYDSYLSCTNLEYRGNTWKNNLNFNAAKTNNTLLKSKGGPDNIKLNRIYEDNKFIIEKSYIEMCSSQLATRYGEDRVARLAKDLDASWIEFFSLTRSCASYQILNNTFDIYDLRMNYQNASIEHMLLQGNIFRCTKIGGTLLVYGAVDDSTNYGNNTCVVRNNTIEAQSLSRDYFNIVRTGWANTVSGRYGTITIDANTINAPCSHFLYNTQAKGAVITNNTVSSAFYKGTALNSYIDCTQMENNQIN